MINYCRVFVRCRSESGETGRGGNTTLVALISNHLYVAIVSPVRAPAEKIKVETEDMMDMPHTTLPVVSTSR